ncbi:MAG: hypothetical protein ABIH69_01855 [bacterium]
MIEYFYEKEIRSLNENQIKYLVVGGVAVNLYGLRRLTRDLDLMIDLSSAHFDKFLRIMGELRYFTNIPEEKWKDLVAIAFRCQDDPDKRIDVFMRNPIDFEQAYKNRKIFETGDFIIDCVGWDDLLEMKNKADRLRDWIDVGSLQRLKELEENEKKNK